MALSKALAFEGWQQSAVAIRHIDTLLDKRLVLMAEEVFKR